VKDSESVGQDDYQLIYSLDTGGGGDGNDDGQEGVEKGVAVDFFRLFYAGSFSDVYFLSLIVSTLNMFRSSSFLLIRCEINVRILNQVP